MLGPQRLRERLHRRGRHNGILYVRLDVHLRSRSRLRLDVRTTDVLVESERCPLLNRERLRSAQITLTATGSTDTLL